MNIQLKAILTLIQPSEGIAQEEKKSIPVTPMGIDEELEILVFKLERLEKIKRTTSILFDETIAALEQRRKAIEVANITLQKSLEYLKATQAQTSWLLCKTSLN